eukprot:3465275-Amphidinium_carterae.1
MRTVFKIIGMVNCLPQCSAGKYHASRKWNGPHTSHHLGELVSPVGCSQGIRWLSALQYLHQQKSAGCMQIQYCSLPSKNAESTH